VLQGISQIAVPDRLIRACDLASALPDIAQAVDLDWPIALHQVVTDDIQRACEKAFARDYDLYGFSNWEPVHRP